MEQAVSDRRRALRRLVDLRAGRAVAGVPEVLGVVCAARESTGRAEQRAAPERAGLGWQSAGDCKCVLAVRALREHSIRRPPRLRQNDVTFGNESLKNERAREWEVGTEIGAFGGRVGLEATYYDRLVSDLLFFRPLPTSTGFSRQFSPIGTMSNKGIELLLRTVNVDQKNLRWESTVTYTRNKNHVESLDILDFQSAGGYPNRIRAGEPVGVFYGSYAARNCATGALLLDSLGRYRRSNQTADMGTRRTARRAISGGTCNDSLNDVIGDPNPTWLGSMLNEVTIGRKLRLRALFDGTFGNDVLNLSTRAQNAGIASNSKEYERELLPYGDPRKLAAQLQRSARRASSSTGSRTAAS